jgi:hypothetical protein
LNVLANYYKGKHFGNIEENSYELPIEITYNHQSLCRRIDKRENKRNKDQ